MIIVIAAQAAQATVATRAEPFSIQIAITRDYSNYNAGSAGNVGSVGNASNDSNASGAFQRCNASEKYGGRSIPGLMHGPMPMHPPQHFSNFITSQYINNYYCDIIYIRIHDYIDDRETF